MATKRGRQSEGRSSDQKRRRPMSMTPMQRYERKQSSRSSEGNKDHTVYVYAESLCTLEDRDFERMKCGLTETIVSPLNFIIQ
jgi:hypothetical protein